MFSSSQDFDKECARMSDKQLVQHFCHYDRQVSDSLTSTSAVSSEPSGLTLGTALVLASLDGYAAARAQKKRGILGRHVARRGLQGDSKLRGHFDAAVRDGVALAVAAVIEAALQEETESSGTEDGDETEWDKDVEVEVFGEEVFEVEVDAYEAGVVDNEKDGEGDANLAGVEDDGEAESEAGEDAEDLEVEEEEECEEYDVKEGEEEEDGEEDVEEGDEEEEGACVSDGYGDSNYEQGLHAGYCDTGDAGDAGDAYYQSDPDFE
ncbi:hypothetical protein CSOJ01_04531 [Colletotrichum sojae]|uniref:Uncharacterized protein n=1 Tax=Colletotrichum sojae TaxID=2175907 RepID=A0A8H6MYF4_9PEZI|nr:hypothetical protein CSOJ01_04531 [Colletotrichum sojae]